MRYPLRPGASTGAPLPKGEALGMVRFYEARWKPEGWRRAEPQSRPTEIPPGFAPSGRGNGAALYEWTGQFPCSVSAAVEGYPSGGNLFYCFGIFTILHTKPRFCARQNRGRSTVCVYPPKGIDGTFRHTAGKARNIVIGLIFYVNHGSYQFILSGKRRERHRTYAHNKCKKTSKNDSIFIANSILLVFLRIMLFFI